MAPERLVSHTVDLKYFVEPGEFESRVGDFLRESGLPKLFWH
jgi:hypothetical protein